MTDFDKLCDYHEKTRKMDCTVNLLEGGAVRIDSQLLEVIHITEPDQPRVSAHIFKDDVLIINNESIGMALCLSPKHYSVINAE